MPITADRYFPDAPDAVLECQDNLAFMDTLKSASMHLIVTSPPYNIGKR